MKAFLRFAGGRLVLLWLTFLLAGCSSILYYPVRGEFIDRKRLPTQPEDIYFTTADGVRLHGWYFHNAKEPARGVVVQFHGNGQNLSAHFVSLYGVLDHGFDLLAFDYRGYGQSAAAPTPPGTVEDGKTVLRWLHENKKSLPIYVFGQSLGGAIAMRALEELNEEIPIELLVLDSTFASYRSVARRVASHHWLTWLFQPVAWLLIDNSASPSAHLERLGPYKKLVVHGRNDKIVDYRLGEELFEKLPEPKEFWAIDNGNHIDFLWRERGRYFGDFIQLIKLTKPLPQVPKKLE